MSRLPDFLRKWHLNQYNDCSKAITFGDFLNKKVFENKKRNTMSFIKIIILVNDDHV